MYCLYIIIKINFNLNSIAIYNINNFICFFESVKASFYIKVLKNMANKIGKVVDNICTSLFGKLYNVAHMVAEGSSFK